MTLPARQPTGNRDAAARPAPRVLSTGTDTGRRKLHLLALGEVAGPAAGTQFRAGSNRNSPFSADSPSSVNPRSGSRRQRGRR